MNREIRVVYFTEDLAVSFRNEAEAIAHGYTRKPDAYSVYERESDGTIMHVADFASREEAESAP